MHLAALPVICVAGATLLTAVPQRSGELVGRWKGAIQEEGGTTEVVLEFFPNGTYARRIVVINEFGWTQEGDRLILAPALERRDNDVSYGKATVVSIKLANDVLTIADAKQSISMKRATIPVNESALIGRWEGQSDLNEGIVQDFLSDGRLIVTVTLAREAGRYAIQDETINWEVQIPDPKKKKTKFRVEGDKLLLYLGSNLPTLEMKKVVQTASQ